MPWGAWVPRCWGVWVSLVDRRRRDINPERHLQPIAQELPLLLDSLDEYAQGGQRSVRETYYSGEAAGPSPITNAGTLSVQTWSKVDIRRLGHIKRRDEYVFTTDNGNDKSTDRDDWKEALYKGKKAWYYRYKGVHFYTCEKPGG